MADRTARSNLGRTPDPGADPIDHAADTDTTGVAPERIYAAYLAAQALVGVLLWVGFAASDTVRGWFDLMPAHPAVTDAFVLADLLVAVAGSALSAWAVDRRRSWAVPAVAFTAGAMVYPTFYLIAWVSFAGTGTACLAIMVPPAILTCWIAYQTWRTNR